jgi:C4-dicarboxylate-specific signal transduction histidine kinase
VIDLRPVVREVLALLGHELRLNGVTTTESLGEAPPVLVNLIRNAIEAMAHTATRDRRLSIEMGTIDRRVRVSVGDSGQGIDPNIAPRLFHPFQSTKPAAAAAWPPSSSPGTPTRARCGGWKV